MVIPCRALFVKLSVCALLLPAPQAAMAAKVRPQSDAIVSGGQVTAIFVGVAAIGAAIGVGIYFAIRHNRSITGCASDGPNGLQLRNEGDQQSYALIGDVATIKAGERVRVSGKKKKGAGSGQRFLVEKVSKDFGACRVQTAP